MVMNAPVSPKQAIRAVELVSAVIETARELEQIGEVDRVVASGAVAYLGSERVRDAARYLMLLADVADRPRR